MTKALMPMTDVTNVAIPSWARSAVRRAARGVGRPDCILAARIHYLALRTFPLNGKWLHADIEVDDERVGATYGSASGDAWFAAGLRAGLRTISVVPSPHEQLVEPVTLKIQGGTIILVDIYPEHYRWLRCLSPDSPCVKIRVLPSGFAHSGRWGRRWARRLGWDDQAVPTRTREGS